MRTLIPRLAVLSAFALAVVGCGGSNGTALPTTSGPNGTGQSPGNYQSGCSTLPSGQCVQATAPPNLIPPLTLDSGLAATSSSTVAVSGYNVTGTASTSAANPPQNPLSASAPASAPTNPPFANGSHIFTFTGNSLTQAIVKDATLTAGINPGGTQTIPNATVPYNGLLYTYITPGFTTNFVYSTVVVNAWFAAVPAAVVAPATPPPPAPASVTVQLEIVGGATQASFDFRTASCGTLTTKTGPYVPTTASFTKLTCALPAVNATYDSIARFPNPVLTGATGTFDPVSGSTVYLVLTPASGLFSPTVTTYQFGFGGIYATQ